uniref:30S ribosomal protein S10, chloroplastic n=1 Tax=Choreocolax polysiphoniae TaxID=282351 RepID=A0A0B5VUI8_9FLOR|nr:30S ribosomal protein S10 [Choreocolax polysiphoniae]AJH65848.1 30S ribosomal protein S10 [Choreocolax polysiphoniae]
MINQIQQNKIKIKLKTYNHILLLRSCKYIIEVFDKTKVKIIGPISLPTQRRIYCVLRSPHIDKDSREHFEVRIYTKFIYIYKFSIQIIDQLMKLNITSGVDIEVK